MIQAAQIREQRKYAGDYRERGWKQQASPFVEYEYSKQRVAAILLTERDRKVKRYFIEVEVSQELRASNSSPQKPKPAVNKRYGRCFRAK